MKDKFKFKYNIVVSGSAVLKGCKKGTKEKIIELAKEIAKQKCVLISGATTGVPHAASIANRDAGGFNIGFSPAASRQAHQKTYKLPTAPYDVIIYTGTDYVGRDVTMTKSADAVIIISGRIGTMHEFLVAFETGKVIGVLEGTGGTADGLREFLNNANRQPKAPIIFETDPKKLIKKVIKEIKIKRN